MFASAQCAGTGTVRAHRASVSLVAVIRFQRDAGACATVRLAADTLNEGTPAHSGFLCRTLRVGTRDGSHMEQSSGGLVCALTSHAGSMASPLVCSSAIRATHPPAGLHGLLLPSNEGVHQQKLSHMLQAPSATLEASRQVLTTA